MSDTQEPYRVVIEERDRAPDNYAVKAGLPGLAVAGFNNPSDADNCCRACNIAFAAGKSTEEAAYTRGASEMREAAAEYVGEHWCAPMSSVADQVRSLPLPGQAARGTT